MRFSISQELLSAFPAASVGIIVGRNMSLRNAPRLGIDASLLEGRGIELESISSHPGIACWREAYRKFGSRPSDYKSSVEALARRVLKNGRLDSIAPMVDIYNYISVKHLLPVGGEDMDRMQGDIQLRFASDGEAPVECLGDTKVEAPYKGEVIYADSAGTMCRRWNWREAHRTSITQDSKNVFFCVDNVEQDQGRMRAATEEMLALLRAHFDGEFSVHFADSQHPSMEL